MRGDAGPGSPTATGRSRVIALLEMDGPDRRERERLLGHQRHVQGKRQQVQVGQWDDVLDGGSRRPAEYAVTWARSTGDVVAAHLDVGEVVRLTS